MTGQHPESQHPSSKASDASTAIPADLKQPLETWLRTAYLGSDDGSCGVPLSVRDFINYLRHETPATADFTTENLDWALETIEKQSDTVIAPTTISQTLYGIGAGHLKDNGSQTVQQQYPEYSNALKGKRYVFLPVNNGFASDYKAVPQENQNSHTDLEKPASQGHVMTPQLGGHWSFIAIDTQSGTASYIDDRVKVEKLDGKRYQISHIKINGAIAGRVLCGFDTFMQREKGQLNTTTLKWIPNVSAPYQKSRPDAGPCGPFVWKMISFILANRDRTLRGAKGLKGFFSEEQKGKIIFDLLEARRQIQQQLQHKRERKEAAGDLYPYNLTPSTISKILTPDFLRQVVIGSDLKAILDKFEPPAKAEDNDSDIDDQAAALAYWQRQKVKLSKLNEPPTGWTKQDKERLWKKMFPHLRREDALRFIDKYIPNSGGAETLSADEEWQKRQEFAVEKKCIPEPLDNVSFYNLVWIMNEELRADYNLENGLEPDHPGPELAVQSGEGLVAAKARTKTFPNGFEPDRLPNFATDGDLGPWFEEIRDLYGTKQLFVNSTIMRALLHRTYKGSFKKESTEDLQRVWCLDSHAFSREELSAGVGFWTPSDIAQRMDDTYVDLEIPLFITLTDDEVKTWMMALGEFKAVVKAKNKSAGHDRTRGLLHRLFVGEFVELRAEGDQNNEKNIQLLEDWRTHDPHCSKTEFPTLQAAVSQLENLYGTQEKLYLPFLKESPLYWPPRSLLDRGQKRKRDDESPGEAPKKTKTTTFSLMDGIKPRGHVKKPVNSRGKGKSSQKSRESQPKDGGNP